MNRKIILASESANRRSVLDALNVIYEALPARIDEKTIRDEDLAKRAEKLARAKAEKLAKKYPLPEYKKLASGEKYDKKN